MKAHNMIIARNEVRFEEDDKMVGESLIFMCKETIKIPPQAVASIEASLANLDGMDCTKQQLKQQRMKNGIVESLDNETITYVASSISTATSEGRVTVLITTSTGQRSNDET